MENQNQNNQGRGFTRDEKTQQDASRKGGEHSHDNQFTSEKNQQ